MSNKIETIIITPPSTLAWEGFNVETYKSEIHTCPVCNGMKGRHYSEHDIGGERFEECRMCKGVGKIQADISVSWQPLELTDEDKEKDRVKRILTEMVDCFKIDTTHYRFADFEVIANKRERVINEAKSIIEGEI